MYRSSLELLIEKAESKREQLTSNGLRYFIGAALAGAYVGLGMVLIFMVGAPLFAIQSPVTSLVMGASFGVSLTLVLFAGSELFTGNNMYFTVSTLAGRTSWRDTLWNWVVTYVGNFLGALVLVLMIVGAGVFKGIDDQHLLMVIAAKKMHYPFWEAFFRGILCNWFVCLAIWTSLRVKSEPAKLILIWWMLYGFIASGYEHSVANMTVFTLAWLLPHPETISLSGVLHNLIPVTLGNIVGGGVMVGGLYWLMDPVKLGRRSSAEQEQGAVTPPNDAIYGK